MKRLAASTMAFLLLTTACGGGDDGDGSSADSGTLTITTWSAEAAGWKEWWPMVADAFEEKHPNVTVNIQQIAFGDYVSSLTTRMVAGEGPEIIHVPLPLTTVPGWADGGFLKDLTEFTGQTDIPENWPDSQTAMEWDDKTYGVLLQDYGYVLFYNEAILAEAGAEVPTTVDELLSAAQAATTESTFGYTVTTDNTVNFLRDLFMFVSGSDATWIDDGAWNLTDPDVVAAVDVWRTLATAYAPQGTDINQKRQAFFDGNVAFMIEGPFILGQIPQNAPENVADSLHVAQLPMPQPPGDTSNGLAVYEGIDDDMVPLAEEFIELASSQEMLEPLATGVTSPVTRREANTVLSGNPDIEEVAAAAENMTELVFPVDATGLRADFADFQSIAVDQLHALLTSDTPTEEVLAGLQEELEAQGIEP